MAWADGSLDERERREILARAEKSGIVPDSPGHAILQSWLERKPEPKLLTAWIHMVEGLCERMTPEQIKALRTGLIERAQAIASASGGLLGMGKVSGSGSRHDSAARVCLRPDVTGRFQPEAHERRRRVDRIIVVGRASVVTQGMTFSRRRADFAAALIGSRDLRRPRPGPRERRARPRGFLGRRAGSNRERRRSRRTLRC